MRNIHRQQGHSSGRGNIIAGIAGAVGVLSVGLLYRVMARNEAGTMRLPFRGPRARSVHLQGSVNIDRSPESLYRFWRRFEDLPKVMTFLDRVEEKDPGVTHWVVQTPLGATVEWDSEVVEDLPNHKISWRSLEGSDIRSWGDIEFHSRYQGRSSDVVLNLHFEPPGKGVGAAVERFLGGLERAVLNQNLRNFKAYMETGEVPTGG